MFRPCIVGRFFQLGLLGKQLVELLPGQGHQPVDFGLRPFEVVGREGVNRHFWDGEHFAPGEYFRQFRKTLNISILDVLFFARNLFVSVDRRFSVSTRESTVSVHNESHMMRYFSGPENEFNTINQNNI